MKKHNKFAVLFLILCSTSKVQACSCAPLDMNVESNFNKANAIYLGTAISSSQVNNQLVQTQFSIKNTIKGNKLPEVFIQSNNKSNPCGIEFENNKTYLVFASNSTSNILVTNYCLAGSTQYPEIANALLELGKLRK